MNNRNAKSILPGGFLLFSLSVFSQTAYEDSVRLYVKNYVQSHEVVKGADKRKMAFYAVNKAYRVVADFTPSASAEWLSFKTSGTKNKVFKLYGTLSFLLNGKACTLNLYRSQELMTSPEYKDYLFLPFTDVTSGKETYGSGRYLDLTVKGIHNNKVTLDFNKAYNPYCAYVSGVDNCPIPPKENALVVEMRA